MHFLLEVIRWTGTASTGAWLDGVMDEREPVERRPLNPSARSSTRLGLGEVDIVAPGVLHVRLAGAVQVEHLEPMMFAAMEQFVEGKRVLVAIDADDVHAYKSEVRKILQCWLRDIRPHADGVWMLYRSPVIKMGIGLMNAFTGDLIRGFTDPEEFDAELARVIREARQAEAELRAH